MGYYISSLVAGGARGPRRVARPPRPPGVRRSRASPSCRLHASCAPGWLRSRRTAGGGSRSPAPTCAARSGRWRRWPPGWALLHVRRDVLLRHVWLEAPPFSLGPAVAGLVFCLWAFGSSGWWLGGGGAATAEHRGVTCLGLVAAGLLVRRRAGPRDAGAGLDLAMFAGATAAQLSVAGATEPADQRPRHGALLHRLLRGRGWRIDRASRTRLGSGPGWSRSGWPVAASAPAVAAGRRTR